jgi:hypothetical protein
MPYKYRGHMFLVLDDVLDHVGNCKVVLSWCRPTAIGKPFLAVRFEETTDVPLLALSPTSISRRHRSPYLRQPTKTAISSPFVTRTPRRCSGACRCAAAVVGCL